jgi:hypothetical protein
MEKSIPQQVFETLADAVGKLERREDQTADERAEVKSKAYAQFRTIVAQRSVKDRSGEQGTGGTGTLTAFVGDAYNLLNSAALAGADWRHQEQLEALKARISSVV